MQQEAHYFQPEEDELLHELLAQYETAEPELDAKDRTTTIAEAATTTKEKLLRLFQKDDVEADTNTSTNSFGSIFRKKQ